jgi:hypothetical protein
MACSITDPASCFSSVASSVAGDAFSSIAHDFARAADSTINWLWTQVGTATSVHLGGAAFSLDLGIVATITGVVAVGLFLIQIIGSTLRRDPSGLARAFRGLFVAFIAGGAAVAITNISLAATDSLSAGVVQAATGTDMSGMGSRVLSSSALTNVSNPAAMLLLSIAAIAATLIVWLALTVRKVLIVVSAVLAPLAFAGSLADITVSWTRRWIEIMAALIVSKLLLVLIFIIGWGVLDGGAGQNGTGSGQQLTQLVSGMLILAVAGFAPWLALKMVHFSGEQFHQLHGLATTGTAGAQKVAAAPQKVAAWTATAGTAGVGGASAASATAGSSSIPSAATGGQAAQGAQSPGGAASLTLLRNGPRPGSDTPQPPGATAGSSTPSPSTEPPNRIPVNPIPSSEPRARRLPQEPKRQEV